MIPNARYPQPSFRRLIKFRPNESKMSHFVAVTLFTENVVHEDVNGVQPKEHEHPFSSNFLLFSSSTRSVWHEIQGLFSQYSLSWIRGTL
jgi:hypothetical protein